MTTSPGNTGSTEALGETGILGQHSPHSAYRTSIFEQFEENDAADLIAEYPLAWLCPMGAGELATQLPLIAERDPSGSITRLIGHMARTNPLWPKLAAERNALVLFQGPQAYVSPATVGRRNWVPTWNYAQLRIKGQIRFLPDRGDAALSLLVDTMERSQPEPWHVAETGKRYGQMIQSIIAFDVDILSLTGRFKLGQDETSETLRAILANHPDAGLVRWMKRFNKERW